MEGYFCEKRKIFNGENGPLPKVAVINADCPYGKRLIEELPPHVQLYHLEKKKILLLELEIYQFQILAPNLYWMVHLDQLLYLPNYWKI